MPVPYWPPAMPQKPWTEAWTGGPQDTRAAFEPDVGDPLFVNRTTADVELYEATFRQVRTAQLVAFEAWVKTTLSRGTLAWCWRDPISDVACLWKFAKAGPTLYRKTGRRADLHDLAFSLVRKAGVPWWSGYLRSGESRPPQIVADWNGGVFGYDGNKVAASVMPTLSGSFDVVSVSTSDVVTYATAQVIAVAGIPATAPLNVKRRIYFIP